MDKKDNIIGNKHFTASHEIVYYITVEDLQTVASQILERELSESEIVKVAEQLGDHVEWFDAIEHAIYQTLLILQK